MTTVDTFVFFDDVQYIKRGWINRNRLLLKGEPAWITLPVASAARELPINKRVYLNVKDERLALLRKIDAAYSKAPYFRQIMPSICDILSNSETNVALFNQNTLIRIAYKMNITCSYTSSSSVRKDEILRGEEKIIDICKHIGASEYINPPGGVDLYDRCNFRRAGLKLSFLQPRPASYKQFDYPHVPYLSIIDVLMFNGFEGAQELLKMYEVVD